MINLVPFLSKPRKGLNLGLTKQCKQQKQQKQQQQQQQQKQKQKQNLPYEISHSYTATDDDDDDISDPYSLGRSISSASSFTSITSSLSSSLNSTNNCFSWPDNYQNNVTINSTTIKNNKMSKHTTSSTNQKKKKQKKVTFDLKRTVFYSNPSPKNSASTTTPTPTPMKSNSSRTSPTTITIPTSTPTSSTTNEQWYTNEDYKNFTAHARATVAHILCQSHTWNNRTGGAEQFFSYEQIKDICIDDDTCTNCRCIPVSAITSKTSTSTRRPCTSKSSNGHYCHYNQQGQEQEYEQKEQNDTSIVVVLEALSCYEFGHLVRWIQVGSFSYGLEKSILKHLVKDRIQRKRLLFDTIEQIQNQQKQKWRKGSNINSSNSNTGFQQWQQQQQWHQQQKNKLNKNSSNGGDISRSSDSIEEYIRFCCEDITRPCRLFARTMGHAVSVAEGTIDEEDDVYLSITGGGINNITFGW